LHLRGLSAETLAALVAERSPGRGGPYRSLEDFLQRVPAGRRETENLILAGAFDGFGLTQPELLFHFDGIYASVSSRAARGAPLLGAGEGRRARDLHPGLRDSTLMERCENEKRLFKYMISGDPLEVLDMHPAARGSVPAADIGRHAGRRVKVFGHYVTERSHEVARSGKLMRFLTLEDRSGTVDVIFWPDMLQKWEEELLDGSPFEVWGKVTEEWDTFSLEADRVVPHVYLPHVVNFEIASARLRASQEPLAKPSEARVA
jgi:DNA polymerase-3 subunit alpha